MAMEENSTLVLSDYLENEIGKRYPRINRIYIEARRNGAKTPKDASGIQPASKAPYKAL